jgi:hypothetical protein
MGRAAGVLTFYGPAGLVSTSTGTALALTRAAQGQWYLLNTAGALTYNVLADNSLQQRPGNFLFPAFPGQYETSSGVLLLSNEYQEAFGTTPASPGAPGPGNPFSGVAAGTTTNQTGLPAQLPQGTPAVPWGIALIDIFAVYAVATAALTTATISVSRNIFAENTALVNTSIVAAQAMALTTTTSLSTPHVQRFAVPQPVVFEAADFSQLVLEAQFVTAATSLLYIYGLGAHYALVYG